MKRWTIVWVLFLIVSMTGCANMQSAQSVTTGPITIDSEIVQGALEKYPAVQFSWSPSPGRTVVLALDKMGEKNAAEHIYSNGTWCRWFTITENGSDRTNYACRFLKNVRTDGGIKKIPHWKTQDPQVMIGQYEKPMSGQEFRQKQYLAALREKNGIREQVTEVTPSKKKEEKIVPLDRIPAKYMASQEEKKDEKPKPSPDFTNVDWNK